jgi:hypothetical protein
MKRIWFTMLCGVLLASALPAHAAIFSENFESGQNGWSADNGVWEIGAPNTVGPAACAGGSTNCAGTNLSGNYPADGTDSRLLSPSIVLPAVTGTQQIRLRFSEWHEYAVSDDDDSGQVQISIWDPDTLSWSAYQNIGEPVRAGSPVWSLKDLDLTAFANRKVKLAFRHINNVVGYYGDDVASGWYIDDVAVILQTPLAWTALGGDFEAGWGQWSADNGVWEVGAPTAGPGACHNGGSCVGTILAGNYPAWGTDSALFSPEIQLPPITGYEEILLRFWEWHEYAVSDDDDSGQVQISIWDPDTLSWSAWTAMGEPVRGSSAAWTLKEIDLTAFANRKVKLAFRHINNVVGYYGDDVASGWYLDDIEIVAPTKPPVPQVVNIVQTIGLKDLNGKGAQVATLTLIRDAVNGDAMEVLVRDASDPTQFSIINYGTPQGKQAPLALAEMPDLNANGTPEIAVLIKNNDGSLVVDIRDALTSTLIKQVNFNKISALAKSLAVLGDLNGNGVPELGVLIHTSTALTESLVIRDAESGKLLKKIAVP